ncbi:MAG: glycoside hydrolase family 18 protein [Clostridiaceae bacterium]|nr:glycoside hydrolase family 18 protein [Clostridiaceae bacterium]
MKIHVVRPGDSTWALSRTYGVSQNSIIEVNGLEAQSHLVIGQALVIPSTGTTHVLRAGESLWTLSKRYGVSVDSIIELNKFTNEQVINPGQVIRIPDRSKNYGVIESNGFIQPSTPEKETVVLKESAEYLTYLSPFSHHVNADGSLTELEDETIVNIGKANKNALMLSITNLNESNFDTVVIDNILKSNQLQQTLINNILIAIREKGYYGVIIDFERITPINRELYNNFLRKTVDALHKENKVVATALAPKTFDIQSGSWHGAHDYRAHGEIVDFVIIMTYEWGWSGGPPMAVAPLNEVRKVINYAVSVIPRKKIMMGIPLYGYDWTLPYIPKGEFAEGIGCLEAVVRAANVNAIIKYDMQSQSPFYNYFGKDRAQHVVWFEDARSIMAKFKLVSEYGLRGVSYWSLGQPFPQNWYLLDDMFRITKLVK